MRNFVFISAAVHHPYATLMAGIGCQINGVSMGISHKSPLILRTILTEWGMDRGNLKPLFTAEIFASQISIYAREFRVSKINDSNLYLPQQISRIKSLFTTDYFAVAGHR